MHKPPVRSSDPQTAIAIAEQPSGLELGHRAWERIRLRPSVNESSDSALCADQERTVLAFTETLDTVRLAGQRIEFWRTRFPSTHPPRDYPCCPRTTRRLRDQPCCRLRSIGRCHSESCRALQFESPLRQPTPRLHDLQGAPKYSLRQAPR